MNGLGQWAMTVCVIAVICAILEMLVPDKKYARLLKPAIAAFAVYAVIFPAITAFKGCSERLGGLPRTEINTALREKVNAQAEDAVRSAVSAAVRSSVDGETSAGARIDVELETRGDGSISLLGVTVTVRDCDRARESVIIRRAAAACGLEESKITVNYE